MSSENITHQGIIDSITENMLKIKIINMSACSSCHAKGACSASDMEEKIIDVYSDGENFNIGQMVTISSKLKTGFTALFYGYVLPFIAVLITLIVLSALSFSEVITGLISLAILIPYYLGLYLFRDQLKKSITFEILK